MFIYRNIGFIFLGVVALFLILGNFPRIVPFAVTTSSSNLSELILYFFTLCCTFFVVKKLLSCQLFLILLVGVFFSLVVGLVKWGIDITAMLYNMRLMLQITTAAVAGVFLHEHFGDNLKRFIGVYLSLYGLIVALSYMIFFIFPDNALLISALGDSGIEFGGDPHVGRLVSPYIDPNLFGIIIVLPITMALFVFRCRLTFLSGIFALYLIGALILTISRSGLSLFVLWAGVLSLGWLLKNALSFGSGLLRVKKSSFLNGMAFILAIILLMFLISPVLNKINDRFTNVSYDGSAIERVNSFYLGVDLFNNEPLFGYGYNYSIETIKVAGRIGLDSGLQVLLVNFGLLPVLCLTLYAIGWWVRVNRSLKSHGGVTDDYHAWRLLTIYVILTIFWAGNFNAILFYPFWLVPVLSMFMYFEFIINGKRSKSKLVSATGTCQ